MIYFACSVLSSLIFAVLCMMLNYLLGGAALIAGVVGYLLVMHIFLATMCSIAQEAKDKERKHK